MTEADPLAALFAQYLSGGIRREIQPGQLAPGPSFGSGAPMPGGGGTDSAEAFADGLLSYLESKDEEEGPGQTQATGWTFDPLRDMPPPFEPAAASEPPERLGLGQTPATGYVPGGEGGMRGSGQTPATGYVPFDGGGDPLAEPSAEPPGRFFMPPEGQPPQGLPAHLIEKWPYMTPKQRQQFLTILKK